MTEKVLEPIKKGSGLIMSGHTYSGHPLSCATAHKVLEIVEGDQLLDNVFKRGTQIKKELTSLQKKYSFIDVVRGKGLMLGVEFMPAIKGLQSKFIDTCFRNGLLVYPAVGGAHGKDENGIIVSPPFIITSEESDELLQKFDQSLHEVSRAF